MRPLTLLPFRLPLSFRLALPHEIPKTHKKGYSLTGLTAQTVQEAFGSLEYAMQATDFRGQMALLPNLPAMNAPQLGQDV